MGCIHFWHPTLSGSDHVTPVFSSPTSELTTKPSVLSRISTLWTRWAALTANHNAWPSRVFWPRHPDMLSTWWKMSPTPTAVNSSMKLTFFADTRKNIFPSREAGIITIMCRGTWRTMRTDIQGTGEANSSRWKKKGLIVLRSIKRTHFLQNHRNGWYQLPIWRPEPHWEEIDQKKAREAAREALAHAMPHGPPRGFWYHRPLQQSATDAFWWPLLWWPSELSDG